MSGYLGFECTESSLVLYEYQFNLGDGGKFWRREKYSSCLPTPAYIHPNALYHGTFETRMAGPVQGCHNVFKLPGKYKKYDGTQTARGFFWFYLTFFSL